MTAAPARVTTGWLHHRDRAVMTEPQRRSRLRAGRAWVERIPPLHLLLAVVGALVLVGVVMVFSASAAGRSVADGTAATVLVRHLVFLAAATVTFLVGMWVAPTRIQVWTPVLLLACLAALVAVLVPGIGEVRGGARRWISIGELTVQP